MNDKNPTQTHWKSTLMAINPDNIQKHSGKIIQTIYNTSSYELLLVVQRDMDSAISDISFTHYPNYLDEDIPNPTGLPASIKDLYEDFDVEGHAGLLSKSITGVYFGKNNLVGIIKNE